jgi:hypothetical protein
MPGDERRIFFRRQRKYSEGSPLRVLRSMNAVATPATGRRVRELPITLDTLL